MTTETEQVDFAHVRQLATRAATCCGMLGDAGEQILVVLSVIELAAELSPEIAPAYAEMIARAHAGLDEAWGMMWDVAGVPRRPLPRLSPTKH